jgi:hypothetical protein
MLGRLADPSKPDVKNTWAWSSQRCLLWRSIDLKQEYGIDFSSTSILDKATGYMDRVIKEALEVRLHPRNLNRDGAVASHWVIPATQWLTCSSNIEIHQSGSKAKLSKHLTPPTSPHWLALRSEHGLWAGICVGWSWHTVTSQLWWWGQRWSCSNSVNSQLTIDCVQPTCLLFI